MKRRLCKFVIAVCLCSAYAFTQTMEEAKAHVKEITASLMNPPNGRQQFDMPAFSVEVVESKEINAYANIAAHQVTVTQLLVQVLYRDPGELAFAIAHEIGHIQDAHCSERAAMAGLSGMRLRRFCEASADKIGMQYILAAGYNPFEPAGLMGKLLMVDPGQSSIFGIMLNRFLADHPVDVDRIRQLTDDAHEACTQRSEICRQ